MSDETVKSAFSAYGEVYSIRHAYFKDFPELRNGNRLLLMSVSNPIPSSLNVFGFVCRAWHPGQPVNCSICKVSGHLPRACPLPGLCRRCKQPGHVARECGQAGDQPRPPSSASVPSPSLSSSPVDPVSDPVSTPSDPVPVPVPVNDPVPDDPSAPAPASVKRLELVSPEDREIVMSSDLSVADASPPRRPRPRVPSSVDYKKLVRLVLPKVKLGSGSSTVKKLCLSMVKAHKLTVSDDECARVAASVCSNS